jgi:predicted CXXCH cytochrome family protein
MRQRRGIVFVAALILTGPAMALGGTIANTKHDLSLNNSTAGVIKSTTQRDTCVFCHVSHNGSPAAFRPLWSHNLTTTNLSWATPTTVRGTTLPSIITSTQLAGSQGCMSCHDGTIALGDLLNKPLDATVVGTNAPAGKLTLGINRLNPTSMQTNHPLGVPKPAAVTGFTAFKTVPSTSAVNYDPAGLVQCDSCHNPHDNTNGTFLKINPAGGAICLTCHDV